MINSEFLPPLSVIVPAFNEESSIVELVKSLRKVLGDNPELGEILVINDGSTDHTGKEAAGAGATVISHPSNRGYGASLKTGVLAASHEIIIILDADNTYPVECNPGNRWSASVCRHGG